MSYYFHCRGINLYWLYLVLCHVVQTSNTINELYAHQLIYQQDKCSWMNCTVKDQASCCSKPEVIIGFFFNKKKKKGKHSNPTLIHLYLCYAVLQYHWKPQWKLIGNAPSQMPPGVRNSTSIMSFPRYFRRTTPQLVVSRAKSPLYLKTLFI